MIENILGSDYPDFTSKGTPPCAESYPDAFFADEEPDGLMLRRPKYSMEYEAKKTCLECPYRAECLAYALRHPDLVGIWGGSTEQQRRYIRMGRTVRLDILPPNKNR